jgi:DNA (cytosine-5)-methyltransferase 1
LFSYLKTNPFFLPDSRGHDTSEEKLKVLDTFAGAGGFSLGFHLTGQYDIIGAIEYDQWAADTFKFNHPESTVIVGDIQQYNEEFLLETRSA